MLAPNDIVVLRCEGHIEGNRWLDGRTVEGAVGLAGSTEAPLTGTWWRTHDAGDGTLFLETLGHLPGHRFLDGRTHDGSVGLAPHTDGTYTGARWRVHQLGNDRVHLESLGQVPGNRFLDGRTHDGSVGLAPHTQFPFTGTTWQVQSALSHFTFAADISQADRIRLLDRHRAAVGSMRPDGPLSADERLALMTAYRKRVNHTTLVENGINARATIGGSWIGVNFGVLFPQGNDEISQTLIHEMMHIAGFTHPPRRDPGPGQTCAAPNPAFFDCPGDGGVYYGTPPLRAELCIAGNQSDAIRRLNVKAGQESCIIVDGQATIRQA